MSSLHHPSDETLVRLAAGMLVGGPSIVVSAHLAGCAACRDAVGLFEAVGGVLLEQTAPSGDIPDGLARVRAAIERGPEPATTQRLPRRPPNLPNDIVWPAALGHSEFANWRWLAPGIRVSKSIDGELRLLRVAPGKSLLRHGHSGLEWTYIMAGSFVDGRARFRPGDICEVDGDIDHRPVIGDEEDCICLIAAEGNARPHGLIGRVHQVIFNT